MDATQCIQLALSKLDQEILDKYNRMVLNEDQYYIIIEGDAIVYFRNYNGELSYRTSNIEYYPTQKFEELRYVGCSQLFIINLTNEEVMVSVMNEWQTTDYKCLRQETVSWDFAAIPHALLPTVYQITVFKQNVKAMSIDSDIKSLRLMANGNCIARMYRASYPNIHNRRKMLK
jgi:hypothetical protein